MGTRVRQQRFLRPVVWLMAGLQLQAIVLPSLVVALSGGPTQPEVQSFEPVTAKDLVDPFTGDFTYNIPLMDVGGYPLNLSYGSGITMDQEASFVGLGWNINPGAINRNVRGLPDDFSGDGEFKDEVTKGTNLKENATFGATIGAGLEVFGYSGPLSPSINVGLNYNTYRGAGMDLGLGIGAGIASGEGAKTSLTANLGISSNNGVTVSPGVSFSIDLRINNGTLRQVTV